MIAAATPPVHDTSAALLAYLQRRWKAPDLGYRQPPSVIPDGWETNTYRFQVESNQSLPASFTCPLVLRAYTSSRGLSHLRHEFAVQRHLSRLNYPVAAPLLEEEDTRMLGGPFMLMQCVPGQTLLEFLLRHPLRIWDYPGRMARLQRRLHALPVNDFPAPAGDFLSRSLDKLTATVGACRFDGLIPGLDWLRANRPASPASPCIIHQDFHPANLMIHEGRFQAVLDWSDADVGDYHADVAATLLLMDAAPVELKSLWRRLISVPGQFLLRRCYFHAYGEGQPIDRPILRYYQAWAAFRRLCVWGQWHYAGPQTTGAKSSTVQRTSPERLDYLVRYFERYAGVAVSLRPISMGSSLALA
jgi:aminoglycoside phosphotransferase (APT) family kinase protein